MGQETCNDHAGRGAAHTAVGPRAGAAGRRVGARATFPDRRPGRRHRDRRRAGRARRRGRRHRRGGPGAGDGPSGSLLTGRVLRRRLHGEPQPQAAVPQRLLQVRLQLLGGGRGAVHLRGAGGRGRSRVAAGDPGQGQPGRRQQLHGGRGRAAGPAPGAAAARRHGPDGAGQGQGALPGRGLRPAGGRTSRSPEGRCWRRGWPTPSRPGYRQVDSGRQRVEVRRAGAGAVLVKGTVAVKPGTVTSVVLLGGAGSHASCTPSAMLPGPGRRRPAASAPGRAGPRPPREPSPLRCSHCPPCLSSWLPWRPAPGGEPGPSAVPARPRRPALAALVVAALVVVLSGCAEAVDNQEHPSPVPPRGRSDPLRPGPGLRRSRDPSGGARV